MKTRRIFLVIICMFSIVNIGICQQSVSDKKINKLLNKIDQRLEKRHLIKIEDGKYITAFEVGLSDLNAISPNIHEDLKNIDVGNWLCPIVYVSYEQALEHCNNSTKYYDEKYIKKNEKQLFKIIARLPTKEEYLEILKKHTDNCIKNCGIDTAGKGLNLRYILKCYGDNLKENKYCNHLYGNVAEMTNVKGVAMGGSWAHDCSYCSPDKLIYYDKPEPWLGFRLVFEVIKK